MVEFPEFVKNQESVVDVRKGLLPGSGYGLIVQE
jgi:hypothetical protein